MNAQTDKNLTTALHGEAFAYARYSLFAAAARTPRR
jgi:rubrerythrin